MTTPLPVEGAVIGGKYRILREIGRGGMGVIYEAHHLELDEVVALKLLRPELAGDRAVSQLFAQEARAAAKVRSPHVAHVYDVVQAPGALPFIVMERLQGVDLAQLIDDQGALDLSLTLELMLQLADALEHAHVRGIVHHDLKPPNLFVSLDRQSRPVLKLIDFGISKRTASGLDTSELPAPQLCGSPAYMAPEQLSQAATTDPRSDIWSLGVILVECLTGHLPFDGATVNDVCAAILHDDPDLRELAKRGFPASVEQLARACLTRDVTQRIQTVADWAARLAAIRAELQAPARSSFEPVVAAPAFEGFEPKMRGFAFGAPLRVAAPRLLFVTVAFAAGFYLWRWQVVSTRGARPLEEHAALDPSSGSSPRTPAAQSVTPLAAGASSSVADSPRRPPKATPLGSTLPAARAAPSSTPREPRKARVLRDEELFNEPQ